MKIESSGAPVAPTPAASNAVSARDRAISALLNTTRSSQAQSTPVSNPTSISPEEMGAISTSSAQKPSFEESSSEPKAETSAPAEPLSSQYAVLARKEKAIRQREQQLRAREAAIKAQSEAPKAPPAPSFDESKYIARDRISSDPFSVLAELGLTYDQLTDMAMNAPKPEQIALNNELKALRDEIKALKGETENNKKSFEDQQTQAYTQAITQIRNEAKALITHNPNFETIKETDSLGDVVELIEQTFKEDGILLTVEDAAQQVEDYLVEEAMKLTKIKKIQQRLQPKASAPAAAKPTDQSKQPQLKTLTNSVGTSRQLSARERALLAFENKLNK